MTKAASATEPAGVVAPPAPLASPASRPSHAARPAVAPIAPPAGVTTPMKGEPSGAALAEARLVPLTCEKVSAEQSEPLLAEMREAVAAELKHWHDEQPRCWAEDREQYALRKAEERGSGRSGGIVLGTSSYGAGGGGRSEGIGLGSVGTIGHGAVPVRRAGTASGTNNQVAGVDEGDIVKTDGSYVYFAANGALRIAEALTPRIVSVTRMPGTVRELFVEGDRAVVYASIGVPAKTCTYGYDCVFAGDASSTAIMVYDVTNRAAPKLVRKIELSGSLIAARRIGNAVHTVVADGDTPGPAYESWPPDLEMCGTDEAIVRKKVAKLKAENERRIRAHDDFPTMRENGVARSLCGNVLRTAMRDGGTFTTLVSFDLAKDKAPPTTASIESRPGAVFASGDALYLSVAHDRGTVVANGGRWYSAYSALDEASEIHKFRIGASPRDTKYVGSGMVPGHVLNQFAMDEWYGYLRVATTRGRVPDPHVESAVSILAEGAGGNLARVGAVEKIAPGEDIRAVRFDDDRGYVVTFKKTDPLYVIDLLQPSRPAILGELKIPGFSTYLHRVDPEHLLSIGFDANDHGNFAFFDGVILQLFDVKNPTEPKLLHKEKIGTRGSSSEAATDHLAFNYFADKGLLAIPMTICDGGGDGSNGTEVAFSGLLVYDVDIDRGFTRLGGVDHGVKGTSCDTWWSNATSTVKRSVFLDDLVYSIAGDRAKVQRMSRLGTDIADLSLMP